VTSRAGRFLKGWSRLRGLGDVPRERKRLLARLREFERGFPPGHFYSPIPSLEEVRRRQDELFAVPDAIPAVDLRLEEQLRLLEALSPHCRDHPFGARAGHGLRTALENAYFTWGDAVLYQALLRHRPPARVIEVGSGFSSCVLLDVNDRFLGGRTSCTFIEPFPDVLDSLLRPQDRRRADVLRQPLQEVDPARFEALERDDVLFVDSTHVSKIGSDVNRLVFELLPRLRPGVRVHFHDVYYPFEYPAAWIYEGRAWNEAYVLRAFLQYNDAFEIRLFNSLLQQRVRTRLAALVPASANAAMSSLWIERV
jgi:hypothetical protein